MLDTGSCVNAGKYLIDVGVLLTTMNVMPAVSGSYRSELYYLTDRCRGQSRHRMCAWREQKTRHETGFSVSW